MSATVVFDVGETLIDETRAWTAMAEVAPLTLFGVLGVMIVHSQDQRVRPVRDSL